MFEITQIRKQFKYIMNTQVGGEEEDRKNHGKTSDGLHEKQKHGIRYGKG